MKLQKLYTVKKKPKAQDAARALFGGNLKTEDMPTTTYTAEQWAEGMI